MISFFKRYVTKPPHNPPFALGLSLLSSLLEPDQRYERSRDGGEDVRRSEGLGDGLQEGHGEVPRAPLGGGGRISSHLLEGWWRQREVQVDCALLRQQK